MKTFLLPWVSLMLFQCAIVQNATYPERGILPSGSPALDPIRYCISQENIFETKAHEEAVQAVFEAGPIKGIRATGSDCKLRIYISSFVERDFTFPILFSAILGGLTLGVVPTQWETRLLLYELRYKGKRSSIARTYQTSYYPLGTFWWAFQGILLRDQNASFYVKRGAITYGIIARFLSEIPDENEVPQTAYRQIVLKDGRRFGTVNTRSQDKDTLIIQTQDLSEYTIHQSEIQRADRMMP